VGEEELSEELLEPNFEGAICEWASAQPALALVTKSWGSMRVSSPVGNLPLTGDATTAPAVPDSDAQVEPGRHGERSMRKTRVASAGCPLG
jgi:hypothetical protein